MKQAHWMRWSLALVLGVCSGCSEDDPELWIEYVFNESSESEDNDVPAQAMSLGGLGTSAGWRVRGVLDSEIDYDHYSFEAPVTGGVFLSVVCEADSEDPIALSVFSMDEEDAYESVLGDPEGLAVLPSEGVNIEAVHASIQVEGGKRYLVRVGLLSGEAPLPYALKIALPRGPLDPQHTFTVSSEQATLSGEADMASLTLNGNETAWIVLEDTPAYLCQIVATWENSGVDVDLFAFEAESEYTGEQTWHFYDGHWYTQTPWSSWCDAQIAAQDLGGYLVTIFDDLEGQALVNMFPEGSSTRWIGLYQSVYVDGYVDPGPPDYPLDGWRWIHGESYGYENWANDTIYYDLVADCGDPPDLGGGVAVLSRILSGALWWFADPTIARPGIVERETEPEGYALVGSSIRGDGETIENLVFGTHINKQYMIGIVNRSEETAKVALWSMDLDVPPDFP